MKHDTLIVGAAPAHGHEAFYRALLNEYRVVIAADAGGEWSVRLGRVPDVTVGDFDSADHGAAERLEAFGSQILCVAARKDESDLDLCVREARRLGAAQLTFAAAFTERIDHTLAAFGSVLTAVDLGATVREPSWTGWAVGGEGHRTRSIGVAPGTTFSVISPGGASGITIEGGSYPFSEGELSALSSLGVSNVATGNEVVVTVRLGRVLVLCVDI
jgi:thiamine pyrophosphokinase